MRPATALTIAGFGLSALAPQSAEGMEISDFGTTVLSSSQTESPQQHSDDATEILLPPGHTPHIPSKPSQASLSTKKCVNRVTALKHSPITDVQKKVLCALKLRNDKYIQQEGCDGSSPINSQPNARCKTIMRRTYSHCQALMDSSQRRQLAQSREELGTMCKQGRFKTPNKGL